MSLSFLEPVHANPWSDDFANLASLNGQVGEAIEAAIRNTRDIARTRPLALRSASVTVLGPAGAGKTHLFGRLRRRLGPRAVFVHIRPLLGVEMTHRFILHEVVRQLGFATGGLRRIDALVGSLLAHLQGSSAAFPQFFVEDYAHLAPESRTEKLEEAIGQVLSTWQELDEVYLRRLLAVPFQKSPLDRALLAWLSGRELDATQLDRIGTASGLGEEVVIPALKTLAATACVGAPIVVVFDQLENLVDRELSSSRLLAYAQLTTDLIDTVHGIIVVQLALDTEWERSLLPSFNLAQQSRLTMQTHLLGLPSEQQKTDLLRLWLERLPDRTAPFPWPLSDEQVRGLCSEIGTTPRMLLIGLGQALQEGPENVDSTRTELGAETGTIAEGDAAQAGAGASDDADRLEERLETTWQEYLAEARLLLDEAAAQNRCTDPARLVDGILAACLFVPELRPIDIRAARPAQMQIARGQDVIFVALLHQSHYRSLGLALAKLAELAEKHEVVAVRELAHDLPPTWYDTLKRRSAFLTCHNARWFALGRQETARLLALDELLRAARSGDVTDPSGADVDEAVVHDWVEAHTRHWKLGSAPSRPGRPAAPSRSLPPAPVARPLRHGSTPPSPPPASRPPLPTGTPPPPGRPLLPNGNGTPPPPSAGRPSSAPPPSAKASRVPLPTGTPSSRPPPPLASKSNPSSKPPLHRSSSAPPPPVQQLRMRLPDGNPSSQGHTGGSDEPLFTTPATGVAAVLGGPSTGVVLTILTRLRLASIERLVREAVRVDAMANRASVMSELLTLKPRLHWIGRSIVHLREEP